MKSIAQLTLVATMIVAVTTVHADDWPQWMGPNRDGVWNETGLIDSFGDETNNGKGADITWTTDTGLGYAGPAVAGDSVFLFDYVVAGGSIKNHPGQRGILRGSERLRRIDKQTGDVLWTADYGCDYSVSYPSGPRSTPTVTDTRVYTLGAMGHLTCFDRASGQQIWQVNIPEQFSTRVPIWGFAAHPLVLEGRDGTTRVYTMIGGTDQAVGAFDATTGALLWKTRSSKDAGYCPLSVIERDDLRFLVAFSPSEVVGLNPESGDSYWNYDISPDYGMSINAPRLQGDRLLVTSYGQTMAVDMLFEQLGAVVAWRDPGAKSLFTANSRPFINDDLAFGCDINSGMFRAISLKDGSQVWQTAEPVAPKGHTGRWVTRHATAFITKIAAEDRFILFNDLGELVFCTLSADGYQESGRTQIVEPSGEAFNRSVVWSHPAYADKAAFVRNDKQLVRVNLAK